ncbi:alpha/beta hydrolase [Streptomyces milbemycinicus]|uniref:alpha/beta hydrolase n=1 Tax=Streptomyces milbemycinicus TaxID=476552 RepID=UPI0033BFC493
MTTTPHAPATTAHHWQPPTGIAPRGTLLILPGRGEHGGVYERFGRRLSADGYLVYAVGTGPDHTAKDVLAEAAAVVGPKPVAPFVLVGSDTGALQALHVAAAADPRLPLEGVILAGTAPTAGSAGPPPGPAPDWDTELAARTACPTHRKRLTEDERFVRGRLTVPVPTHLLADATPALPALILHGGADPISPLERARELEHRLPRVTLGVLHEGLHDVLNDAAHRTIAATIVLWLERLRAEKPILTLESVEPFSPPARP